ncbi:MAG: prepilin peptidase [Acidobacteriota bacterium]|jgi:leader peptidase (prepilin peptidase) / N-methyltransferase
MPAAVLVVIAGLVFGSFLNVCIYRIPRGISVVTPGSRCPHCGRSIRPWENVPLFSYILQRGRCRGCGQPISWVYPAVEAMTALCFLALYLRFGLAPAFFIDAVFFCLLIVLMFIDLFERILPDVLTLSGAVAGFALSPFQSAQFLHGVGSLSWGGPVFGSYLNSALGILFGGGFLWLVAWAYLKLRRIEGMGFGDVKMMAMVGAFLGWQFSWLTILLGSLLGAVLGGLYMWLAGHNRRYELPFGSFLGLAAIIVTLGGPAFVDWYIHFFLGS